MEYETEYFNDNRFTYHILENHLMYGLQSRLFCHLAKFYPDTLTTLIPFHKQIDFTLDMMRTLINSDIVFPSSFAWDPDEFKLIVRNFTNDEILILSSKISFVDYYCDFSYIQSDSQFQTLAKCIEFNFAMIEDMTSQLLYNKNISDECVREFLHQHSQEAREYTLEPDDNYINLPREKLIEIFHSDLETLCI